VTYVYKPEVLDELATHGLVPRGDTAPDFLRDAVRELYKYEIKLLRSRLLAGAFPRAEYAGRVVELRRRYPLLSIATQYWTV
jgi:hypothetical protein